MKKNNRAARTAHFLVECFDVVCQTTVLTTTRARNSKSLTLWLYMKTVRKRDQAKVPLFFTT